MTTGLQALRRRHVWRLLFGAMGGAMCAGELWAAAPRAIGGAPANTTDAFPELTLSLQLGQAGTLEGRRANDSVEAPERISTVPLRLVPTMVLRTANDDFGAFSQQLPGAASAVIVDARTVAGGFLSAQSGINDDPATPQAPVAFDPTPQGAAPRGLDPSSGGLPQPSAPVPFDPAAQGTAPRRPEPAPARPGSGLPDLGSETWAMAPIRWQGSTTTGGYVFDAEDSRTLSINNGLNVVANSFIVAPYIATWSSNFGLNSSTTDFMPETGPKVKTETAGNNLGAAINVFPQSSFPFSAYFGRGSSESRKGENEVVTTGFGATQQYTTADGRDRYSASYSRGTTDNGKNESSFSNMQGSFSTRRVYAPEHYLEGEHWLNATVGFAPDSTEVNTGQGTRLLNATVSHGWTVHQDLSINNQLSLVNNETTQYLGNTRTFNDSNIFLGSSTFNWRPDEDLPLTVSGGANFGHTQSQTAVGGDKTSQQFFSANLSGSYIFSNQLSLSAGGSVATVQSDTGRFNLAAASVGASYNGLPIQYDGYTYTWSVGGGANANTSSDGQSSFGIGTTAGHNLVRDFPIDARQGVTLSAGQSVSFNNQQQDSSLTLSNSVGAGWRASYGDALTANLSASASYATGTDNNQSFGANLMGGGSYQLSSRQSLLLSSNVNWNRSRTADIRPQNLNEIVVDSDQSQMTGSLSLGYAHTSPFSIRNLIYTADLLWTGSDSSQRLVGVNSQNSGLVSTLSLTQMARYRIGRLSFNLSASVIEADSRISSSIFGNVTREFDGFFDGRW